MSTMFNRYTSDTDHEQDLVARSGQVVTLSGEPASADDVEEIIMQKIRFPDGFEAEAFVDELTEAWTTEELREAFEVISFVAPFVVVKRRSDGQHGTLQFSRVGDVRYYHHWVSE